VLDAVELFRGFGFPRTACRAVLLVIEDFRHSPLHAEGQLIRLDAGAQRGVVRIADGSDLVQVAKQTHLSLLILIRDPLRWRRVRKRIASYCSEVNGVVRRTQITGPVGVSGPTTDAR